MKENKYFSVFFKIALVCGISFAIFTSCKTAPQVGLLPVEAFDVLDDEGAMYIHLPVQENKELSQKLILAFAKGLKTSEADLIVSKLDDIHASFGSRHNKKRVQISASGNFPSVITMGLKKDGFVESSYTAKSFISEIPEVPFSSKLYTKDKVQMTLPNSNLICISSDVKPMLDLYNLENNLLNSLDESYCELANDLRADWKDSELYKWQTEDVSTIHFYIVRPQAFLTNLIGTDVSSKLFKLVYAKGDFEKLPNQYYELTLDLEFTDSRYVKPAISILILTLGLTDSEVQNISPTNVQISGVHLSSKQLVNMLGL